MLVADLVNNLITMLESEPDLPEWRMQEIFEPLYNALSADGRLGEFQRLFDEALNRRPALKRKLMGAT
jgi:hypothetical protein